MLTLEVRRGSWLGHPATAALCAALSAGCCAMLAFRPTLAEEVRFLFLGWNLFLAWLPYVAAAAAALLLRSPALRPLCRAGAIASGILWLLFLPNALYLATDLIHLIAGRNRYIEGGSISYLVWYDLCLFLAFFWCGVFLGFLSTLIMHRLTADRFGRPAGWAFVAVVSLLCGYGVFLGRIVRLNSWDALVRPNELIEEVLGNLHWRGAAFSLLFAAFAGVTYLFLYLLQRRGGRED
ncbi:DUF1361 domain-containing protein [Paenibacillus sp.]|uniref:DUF1361 domain-containing protein n=1 Tax=Paenibacillus sp. TaxID=58172 RepID=UPI002D617C2E|nr:DUF1361 domain-containing protein [Paenibacillus sp.]HZG85293.1 DUF1361 domain-containing protein [Paenibacillus sp.]